MLGKATGMIRIKPALNRRMAEHRRMIWMEEKTIRERKTAVICGWCKKPMGEKEWCGMPISHGVCPKCDQTLRKELAMLKEQKIRKESK